MVNKDNGHDGVGDELLASELEAMTQRSKNLKGEGQVAEATKSQLSAVHKLITAPTELESGKYRQALLMGSFLNIDEADRVSAAISEAQLLGLDLEPIIDWIIARCAVLGKSPQISRANQLTETLTRLTLTQNYPQAKKPNQEAKIEGR